MHVKRSGMENYFLFLYKQIKKFFPYFSTLENDQIFPHLFQRSVGIPWKSTTNAACFAETFIDWTNTFQLKQSDNLL